MQNPYTSEFGSPAAAAGASIPPCACCAEAPASLAPCVACGRIPARRRGPQALQLAAIDGLALDLTRRPHLPDALRAALLTQVQTARDRLRPPPKPAPAAPLPVARPVARAVPVEPAPAPPAIAATPPRPILPDWLSRLGPAAAENLMYLLGGFLVVAGAIYFASTAWTTMSGTGRLLLLDGGLLALGGLLIGVGRLLTRGFSAEAAGQRIRSVTAHIAAGLGPLAAVIAGRAALESPLSGLVALVAVGLGTLGARRLADASGRGAMAALAISLAAAAAPWVGQWPVAAALGGGALVGAVARFGLEAPRGTDIGHVAGAAFALAAHVILCTGVFGAGTVALAALAAGLAAHVTGRPGRLAVMALALLAVGPAFTTPDLLPVVCVLATWTAARIALDLGSAPLLAVPLAGSLVAYVTAPAPLRELVQAIKAAFSASMGYGSEPLPLAWYGVTCLPYVLGLAWVARRLRDRPPMARVATGWLLAVTVGLCLLSTVSADPRAPMAVLAADGVTLLAIGLWLRHPAFVALGPLALMAAGLFAAHWLGLTPAGGLLLLEGLALVALATAPLARSRGLLDTLLWSAGLPLVAAGLALLALPPEPLMIPALALLVPGVALRAHRAGAPWVIVTGALTLGLVSPAFELLELPATLRGPVGMALLVAVSEAARRLRRRQTGDWPRWTVPVGLTAAFGGWCLTGAVSLDPLTVASAGLLWAHAAWRLRVAPAAPMSVLALAVAAAAHLVQVAPAWAAPGGALVGLAAIAWARRRTPWIRRLRPLLVGAGALSAAVASVSAVGQRLSGAAPEGALVTLLVLFAACALAPRTRSTPALHGLGMLVPLAAAATVGDLYGLLIAPFAYAALAAARAVGRPLLPGADRAAAGLVLATAAPLGAVLAVEALIHSPLAPSIALAALAGLAGLTVRRHPRAATATALGLALMLLWGPLTLELWPVPLALLPLVYPATALVIALGAHHVGLHRATSRVVAGLIAAALAALQGPWLLERIVGLDAPFPLDLTPGLATAFCGLWAAATLVVTPRRFARTTAALVAVPLVALWPLASHALLPGAGPALELAALAVVAGGPASLALAVGALAATGDVRSPLFAATLTLLVGLPLRAAAPERRAGAIELTIYGAFLAATGWLIALVPSSGRGPAEILPVVGLIAAAFVAGLELLAPRLSIARGQTPLGRALRSPRPVLVLAAIAAGAVVANIGLMLPRQAPEVVVGAGLLAAALLFVAAAHHARRTDRRVAVDAAIAAVALAHVFLATRSDLLAAFDGMHLLLWAAAAPALRFVGGVTELTVRLRARALLLPLPALLVTLPDHGDSAIACLLAATTWGLAARQSGRPAFTGLGLGLLLAAACRVGLAMHVVDPAFYGLPAGLALLVGAWIERETLSRRAVEALQVAGVIIADLSVAVQVVRLDDPLHAMLLFGLGLTSVAVGWARKRGDLMLVGAIAVVVDVTLHLLRTGFARGFLAAALLVGAGAVVLLVAGHHTRRRART